MLLMPRDKQILKFIEDYGSITIKQCAKIFFTNNNMAYDQARKRLAILFKNKFLKRYRQDMRSETIYYSDNKLSFHDLKVLDIYAYIISVGADVTYFKQEYTIPCGDKDYRADGLIQCIYEDFFYPILIECDYTHYTSEKKLMDIYKSGYFQDKYRDKDENMFPFVIIMRPVIPSIDTSLLPYNVLYTNYELLDISNIFL